MPATTGDFLIRIAEELATPVGKRFLHNFVLISWLLKLQGYQAAYPVNHPNASKASTIKVITT